MGIGTSEGVIHDFAGSYNVSVDDFAFGNPYKYVKLDELPAEMYNNGIRQADMKYENETHNLCCNNCHSHVACALNAMKYKGRRDYNMVSVFCQLSKSKYIKRRYCVLAYLPFVIVCIIVGAIVIVSKTL